MANLTGGGLATAKSKQRNGYRKAIKILDLNLNLGRTSFAATCVALLLLLTTRDGECSIGDEILEADKPSKSKDFVFFFSLSLLFFALIIHPVNFVLLLCTILRR